MVSRLRYTVGVIIIATIFVAGIGLIVYGNKVAAQARHGEVADSAGIINVDEDRYELKEIVVDVQGAVRFPGVYRLSEESVMHDAIVAAGGFASDVDYERVSRELNQASPIGDHAKVYIFTKADRGVIMTTEPISQNAISVGGPSTAQDESRGAGKAININTASLSDLDSLPGIGPAIAQRIIDWREANGDFEVIDDLKKVKGVGESLFTSIKDLVVIL